MKKTLAMLFGGLLLFACKSPQVHVEPDNYDTKTMASWVLRT